MHVGTTSITHVINSHFSLLIAVSQWLSAGHLHSPLTGQELIGAHAIVVVPNMAIRRQVVHFVDAHTQGPSA